MFLIQKGEIEGRLNPDFYISTGYELNRFFLLNKFLVDVFQGETQGDEYFNTIKVLKVRNFDEHGNIDFENVSYCNITNERKILKKNDIITPFRGMAINNRKFALFDKDELVTVDNNTGVIRLNKNINPKFVLFFLQSNIGFYQIKKFIVGSSIPALTKEIISKVKIPQNYLEVQDEVVSILNNAYRIKKQKEAEAVELFASIDGYLLQELGIDLSNVNKPHATPRKFFYTSANKLSGGRFDPFYHQTEFEELELAITNGEYKVSKLGNFISQINYGASVKNEYADNGIPFLRISDLSRNEISIKEMMYLPETMRKDLGNAFVYEDDFLISRSGTLGVVALVTKDINGFAYGSFMIKFRLNKDTPINSIKLCTCNDIFLPTPEKQNQEKYKFQISK